MTWDEAKQKVSEKRGHKSWNHLIILGEQLPDEIYREVSELMAQSAVVSNMEFIRSEIDAYILEFCKQSGDNANGKIFTAAVFKELLNKMILEQSLTYPDAK